MGVAIIGNAQAGERFSFNGIEMGQSLETVSSIIGPHVGKLYDVKVEDPSFPLSEKSETHLICLDWKTKGGTIDELAFTFSDDRLSLVQAQGGAIAAITGNRRDTADVFMNYEAFWKDLIVTDTGRDKVWIMSPEAAHPNLFAWDNPYLPAEGGKEEIYSSSAQVPEFLEMGGSLDELKPLLENASSFTFSFDLPPGDPYAQLQIDCFGIEYAGFPRKFEARFGDGRLNMVWILTGKGEEDRIRQKLIASYGDPIFKNEAWEVFEDWQVLLRKDKPEVLLLTKELGLHYRSEFFKQ